MEKIFIHFMTPGGREVVVFVVREQSAKVSQAYRYKGWVPFAMCFEDEHVEGVCP